MIRTLVGVDLALLVVGAGLWIAAAVIAVGLRSEASRTRALTALLLVAGGTLVALGRLAVLPVLAGAGWWFVAEKVLLALPLAVAAGAVAVVLAVPPLLRQWRGGTAPLPTRAATALLAAAAAWGVGVAIHFVVGYPVTPLVAAVVLAGYGLAVLTGALVLAGRPPRAIAGGAGMLALLLLASVGWSWLDDLAARAETRVPGAHHGAPSATPAAATVSVDQLRTPVLGEPDARFELTARQEQVELPSGRLIEAWTFGSVPGPELRVTEGESVEVVLRNEDVAAGVTLHWHGYDVPNGEDGVAGVTQEAVLPGQSFTYRFVAEDPGTYWYHSHQVSAQGVSKGLYGSLVVEPLGTQESRPFDLAVPVHSFGRSTLLGGSDEVAEHRVDPGTIVRLRLINTDQEPQRLSLAGTPFRVVAADGRDIEGPGEVRDELLRIPAGGRLDLEFTMPSTPVLLAAEASTRAAIVLSPGSGATPERPDFDGAEFDLLRYGAGGVSDPGPYTVHQTIVLDRQLRFLDGIPMLAYTVDGLVFPHIPSTVVDEGDVLKLTVVNRGTETHPMHPHGHHVLVLSRNGVAPDTQLWLDTVDVQPGEVWELALVADNPGIWMDHCHNLEHATQGMMFALSYSGVSTPYSHGGDHDNRPE